MDDDSFKMVLGGLLLSGMTLFASFMLEGDIPSKTALFNLVVFVILFLFTMGYVANDS